MTRRLAAYLVADAVGYSSRVEANEADALAALGKTRDVIDGQLARSGGTIIATAGDSVIAEFQTALDAVNAALGIQRDLEEVGAGAFELRIGVHFGDVSQTSETVLGDGLNIAARLEPLAPPGGIVISHSVADQIVGKIDAQFLPVGRRKLKNIARKVELFAWPEAAARKMRRANAARYWPVAAVVLLAALALGIQIARDDEPAMPTGPRIAVLPFEEAGLPADQAFFASGLSRDINAYLSEFSNLFVLSPQSTRQFAQSDCSTIARELDADFILSGTVQRSEDTLRVTTAFTNASDCQQLDSPGPFTRDLSVESVLDIQIDIARKVVAEIGSADAPIFDAALARAIESKAPDNLTAYECVLLSYWFYENFEPDRHRRARDCLQRSVQADQSYSLAWSRLAFAHIESKKYAIDTKDTWDQDALRAAQRAIDLDSGNPDAYYALAIRSQMVGESQDVFRNYAQKAIGLNPNDSFVLADLGTWTAYAGDWDTGKDWVSRAKALNPKHQSWWDFIWQLHAYLESDYDASIRYAQSVNLPGNYMVQAALAAAYAMNNDAEMAQRTLRKVLELKPDYLKDPEQPFRARGMQAALIDKLMLGVERARTSGSE